MDLSRAKTYLPVTGAAPVLASQAANSTLAAPVPASQAANSTLAAKVVEHLLQVAGSPRFKDETMPEALRDVKNFEQLHAMIWEARKISLALSKGDLSYISPEKGVTMGALKSLQSNLKHLAWQAKQIAGGDYSHKVDFIGEFSEAFNDMTNQLSRRISLLKDTSEEYKDKSFRDALTGIYNRMAFMHFAEEAFSMHPDVSTLIITDIDRFKKFNDEYGHLCGDEVLKNFASYLAHALRPSDICSRYGGEEFLMLLPGMPLDMGLIVGERLRAGVEKLRLNYGGQELRVTASFGVCETGPMPEGASFGEFITACISRADANLYRAKEGGRNKVVG
jgi:diguanylate cyclase (GGDEF)-like protein